MVSFNNEIEVHSEEWHRYRARSVGASEIGTILGLNKYMCALKLHHIKLGLYKQGNKNLRMYLGNMSEDLIGDIFNYWEKDKETTLRNLELKRKVRNVEALNSFATNAKYKHLSASLDRHFFCENLGWCAVELKNKTSQSYKEYENKTNPCELLQLATQLLVSEYKKGYLVYLIDNADIEVMELTYEDALQMEATITKGVAKFYGNVQKSRVVLNQIEEAKSNFNMKEVERLEQLLYTLEPDASDDQAYLDYLTEIAKTRKNEIPIVANEEMFETAKSLSKVRDKIKKLEEQETTLKSKIHTFLRVNNKLKLDFGKLGYISIFEGRFNFRYKG
jgi:predicted phage-related endonuclease